MPDVGEMLHDLERLVSVESPSLELEALQKSASNLADLIEDHLGSRPDIVPSPNGPHVHWRGSADPLVLILGHHDTVFPLGTLAERPFAVTDGRATGPGVFDMKAGIVQAIHGVASLPADVQTKVELLFTADEEVGSVTSRALLEERAVNCGAVLVLEPSGDGGAVKIGRKGAGTFEVVATGRASHAGLDPDAGRNALIEVAHQVLHIATLGDPAQGTTVNPTVAHVGTADNVIPAEGRIRVDVRVESADEKQRVEAAMAALTPVTDDVTIEVLGQIGRPPMPTSASADLFPLVNEFDPDLPGVAVGGASDGNFTAALGVPTLDGLGAVGGGAHSVDEYVIVETMPRRAELIAHLVGAITSAKAGGTQG